MKSQSKNIFVSPDATVNQSPRRALSAVTINGWKTHCSIKVGMAAIMILPYCTAYSSSSPSAPMSLATGRIRLSPRMSRKRPMTIAA